MAVPMTDGSPVKLYAKSFPSFSHQNVANQTRLSGELRPGGGTQDTGFVLWGAEGTRLLQQAEVKSPQAQTSCAHPRPALKKAAWPRGPGGPVTTRTRAFSKWPAGGAGEPPPGATSANRAGPAAGRRQFGELSAQIRSAAGFLPLYQICQGRGVS